LAKGDTTARENRAGWGFVAPALVLLGLFMVYPIFWSLWMSFQTG
jgi:lactose/L-arabinose transport system permease protein